MNFKKPPPPIKEMPCTKTELASEMGISLGTLKGKLKSAGLKIPRGLIPPKVKKEILERLKWI